MKYSDVMLEVNELERVVNWGEDFRFNLEVVIDNRFDDCQHMTASDFVDLCVDIARL